MTTDKNDEDNLFKSQMRGVQPLAETGRVHFRPTPKTKPKTNPKNKQKNGISMMDTEDAYDAFDASCDWSMEYQTPVSGSEVLRFVRPGIQTRLLKKLRTGQLPVEDELDLHGYKLEAAREALRSFLSAAAQRGCRVVCVIHGKGLHSDTEGVAKLKSFVAQWLKAWPSVLAFVSAPAQLGGTGAVLVLLKRLC